MVFGRFPWFYKVVSWFLVGSHRFSCSFMFFYGFWLVSMVFHGSRLVRHGSRLVFLRNVPAPNCILARRSSLGPPPGGRHRTYCPKMIQIMPLGMKSYWEKP